MPDNRPQNSDFNRAFGDAKKNATGAASQVSEAAQDLYEQARDSADQLLLNTPIFTVYPPSVAFAGTGQVAAKDRLTFASKLDGVTMHRAALGRAACRGLGTVGSPQCCRGKRTRRAYRASCRTRP